MIEDIFAVDIETDNLDFIVGHIKLISLYNEECGNVYENIGDIKEILENPNILKVFHNAKFDVIYHFPLTISLQMYFSKKILVNGFHKKLE